MAEREHTYEFTYIINSVLNEQQIQDVVQRVNKLVEDNGGELLQVNEWGSRRLAYLINKRRNGYYVNLFFRASGPLIARLERAMEIDDNILRYLTLRMDAKMLRHFERSKQRAQLQAEEASESEES